MKNKMFWISILLVCLLFAGCDNIKQNRGAEKETEDIEEYIQDDYFYNEAESVTISGNGVSLKVKQGMKGYVKYNRYMKLSAEITSEERDFTGWLRVLLPADDGNSMYQKEVVLKSGQMKKLTMYLPANMNRNHMLVSLNNAEGEEVCSKEVSVNMQYGKDTPFIGIYSKKQEQMGYFDRVETQIFYLEKSDFTQDYRGIDVLDVIVISDINTETFSKKQRKAIQTWVKRGGILVLADSGKQKEMAAFKDSLLEWKIGEQKKINTCFGLDLEDMDVISDRMLHEFEGQKAEKVKAFLRKNLSRTVYANWSEKIENIQENPECLEKSGEIFNYLLQDFKEEEIKKNLSVTATEKEKLQLFDYIIIPFMKKNYTEYLIEDAELIIDTQKGKPLMQKVKAGMGNVVVVGCSVSLKKKTWEVTGPNILELIKESFSAQKKHQLTREREQSIGKNNYIYKKGLLATETNNLPNLKLYGVILAVYLLAIGPCYFWLFRRKGKASWLWIAIPVTSLVFSVFIYLLGTSTRIQAPYVNYLSHLHIEKDGEGGLSTWFRLVNHKSTGYEMTVDGNYDIEPFFAEQNYYAYESQRNKRINGNYQYGIEYAQNATKIHLMNTAAFQGMDFRDQEIITCKGDVIPEIVSDDMTLQGNVYNKFSYDLEDCFLFDNGTIYLLGDIPAGESVSLEDVENEKILMPSEYNYNYTELMEHIFSGKRGADYERKRREALAEGCLQEGNLSECFFFGFASEEKNNSFISKLSLDHYGTTAISKDIEITYRANGMEVLPDISEYAYMYDGSETDGKAVLEKNTRILVRYKLPKGYQWKGLAYTQSNNAEFSYFSNGYMGASIFAGTATIFDRRIGREVKILESGKEMNMEIREEYLKENDELTLYYYVDQEIDMELQLPTIMAYVTKVP